MTEPIDISRPAVQGEGQNSTGEKSAGVPSNEVYARVGDLILHVARTKVRQGRPAQDIIREIAAEHDVKLNVGELRLLLASRRLPG